MNKNIISFGIKASDYFELTILRKEFPHSDNIYDGNWLQANVVIQVGGVSANYKAMFFSRELKELNNNLKLMLRNSVLKVAFSPMEPWINFQIQREPNSNKFSVIGNAVDALNNGNSIVFKMLLDEIQIVSATNDIEKVLVAYPVIE